MNRLCALIISTIIVIFVLISPYALTHSSAARLPGAAKNPELPPGGLYVGYYQEDPLSNPEDPAQGTMYIRLDESSSHFSGAMSFNYVECQTASIAVISGEKNTLSLLGKWSGVIDGSAQAGLITGLYNRKKFNLGGAYTNTKGKQFRDIRPCIEYTVAPGGTWELFPVGTTKSADTSSAARISIKENNVSWRQQKNAQLTLISVIDVANTATAAGSAIRFQKILPGNCNNYTLPGKLFTAGKDYIITIIISNNFNVIYFASKKIHIQ